MNRPQFTGHFPRMPVFCHVYMVEAMAQTTAVVVEAGMELTDNKVGICFMAHDTAKFRRKVGPGDQLRTEVETLRGGGNLCSRREGWL